MVFSLISLWPGLLGWLWLSADRPWGILASNFTHEYSWHIESNIRYFVFFTICFIAACWVLPKKTRHRWSRVFLWLPLLAAIAGSVVLYLTQADLPALGASSIVSGALGVLWAALLRTLPTHIQFLKTFRAHTQHPAEERHRLTKKQKRRMFIQSLHAVPSSVSLGLIPFLVLITVISLTASTMTVPEVNVNVDVDIHRLGFFFGFFSALILERRSIVGSWRSFLRQRQATLNVDPELHRELKIEAAKRGVKISELAEQLTREGLRKPR